MTQTVIPTELPDFEGEEVKQAQVRIVNAGDGLSEALAITPEAMPHGAEVFYVLRGEVTQINHRSKDADSPLIRVHTVKADAITKVDPVLARKLLTESAEALEKAKAHAAGQLMLEAEEDAIAREAND